MSIFLNRFGCSNSTAPQCTAAYVRCGKQEAASGVKLRDTPGVCRQSCKDVADAVEKDVYRLLTERPPTIPAIEEFVRTSCPLYAGDCSNEEVFRSGADCQPLMPLKKIRGSVENNVPAWSGVAAC